MSLNRVEQRLYDYLSTNPDEKRFWMAKVPAMAAGTADEYAAAAALESALWTYYVERAQAVPALREAAAREGLQRTSLRNLSELLLRLWTSPRAKPRSRGNNENRPAEPFGFSDVSP